MRQRTLLALSVPLALVGCLAGHAVGYATVGSTREDDVAHGYLRFAPHVVAVCAALLVLALALRVSGRMRGRPSASSFAMLAPLAFACQEVAERLAAGQPVERVLETPVYVGLMAQIPIAILAFLLARALILIADDAVRSFAAPRAFVAHRAASRLTVPVSAPLKAVCVRDSLGRGPPSR